MNKPATNILFIQHELYTWQRAKMWGYDWHLILEEGLRANNVELTTFVTTFLPRPNEICAGKTFDQVWINDITHTFETGAGGGGFILFYIAPEKQEQLKSALSPLLHVPFRFDTLGSQVIYYAGP